MTHHPVLFINGPLHGTTRMLHGTTRMLPVTQAVLEIRAERPRMGHVGEPTQTLGKRQVVRYEITDGVGRFGGWE